VNSSAIGRYADYLTRELVPFVDREFRTLASRDHRGCFGKSSGGYGAMLHGMKYASTWGAIADHSGDAYFDFVYWHDWPNTLNELAKYRARRQKPGGYDAPRAAKAAGRGLDDGRVRRFLAAVWKKPKLSMAEGHCIMNLCMAATYDPDPAAPNGFRLPFNLETGEVLPERWRQWQRHDPVRLVERYKRNLKSLRGIYIDCGWRDQFTSTTARASSRGACTRRASRTLTRNSTTIIPTSITDGRVASLSLPRAEALNQGARSLRVDICMMPA